MPLYLLGRLPTDIQIESILIEVCKTVGLEKKLDEESKGVSSTKATRFSGGEKQRIGIARALIKYNALKFVSKDKRCVFIFDESTSALDNLIEAQIVNQIYRLREEGNLIIVIAHRLPTIVEADQIVFLEKKDEMPKPIITGSHYHAYQKNQAYKDFYDAGVRVARIDEMISTFKGYYTKENFNNFLSEEFKSFKNKGQNFYIKTFNRDNEVFHIILPHAMELRSEEELSAEITKFTKGLKFGGIAQILFIYTIQQSDTYIPNWKILSLKLYENENTSGALWIYSPLVDKSIKKSEKVVKSLLDQDLKTSIIIQPSEINYKLGQPINEKTGYIILEIIIDLLVNDRMFSDTRVSIANSDADKLFRSQLRKAIDSDITFFQPERRHQIQLSWNCFDVAVNLSNRNGLVQFALSHKEEEEFRKLLAPEILHAVALTAVYLTDKSKIEQYNDKLIPDVYRKNAKTNEAVKNLLLMKSKSEELKKQILPESMHKDEIVILFNKYMEAHNETNADWIRCNDLLNHVEGNRLNLYQLSEFFEKVDNQTKYQKGYSLLQSINLKISLARSALDEYCMKLTTYEKYIKDYYGNKGWFSFQREFGEEISTSMVDIAAHYLKKKIVILDQKNEEIYRTKNADIEIVFVEYNGVDHFKKSNMTSVSMDKNIRIEIQETDQDVSLVAVIFDDLRNANQFTQQLAILGITNKDKGSKKIVTTKNSESKSDEFKVYLSESEYNKVTANDNAFQELQEEVKSSTNKTI